MVMMFKRHLYAFVAVLGLSMNNKHTQIHMWIEDNFIIGLAVVRLECNVNGLNDMKSTIP